MARPDIEFDAEGVTLRGWFNPADGAGGPARPPLVMAHGFSAVKGDVPRQLRRALPRRRTQCAGIRQPQLRGQRRRAAPGDRPVGAGRRRPDRDLGQQPLRRPRPGRRRDRTPGQGRPQPGPAGQRTRQPARPGAGSLHRRPPGAVRRGPSGGRGRIRGAGVGGAALAEPAATCTSTWRRNPDRSAGTRRPKASASPGTPRSSTWTSWSRKGCSTRTSSACPVGRGAAPGGQPSCTGSPGSSWHGPSRTQRRPASPSWTPCTVRRPTSAPPSGSGCGRRGCRTRPGTAHRGRLRHPLGARLRAPPAGRHHHDGELPVRRAGPRAHRAGVRHEPGLARRPRRPGGRRTARRTPGPGS